MRARLPARDLALIAVFAALIAALGQLPAFFPLGTTVPVTAQTLGVMLAGSILGGRRGAAAVAVFLVLVAAGLPLLSGGRGGLGVFAGPSVGFLIGWVPGAWVVGKLTELWQRGFALGWALVANVAGGIVVVYAFGIPGMALQTGLPITEATTASWIYIPGDLAKAVIAAFVARGVHRGYPTLLPRSAGRGKEPAAPR